MSEPMTSVPVPAAMPGEDAIVFEIVSHSSKPYGEKAASNAARAILDLFAPILAEKEREIADLGRLVDYDTKALADTRARALAAEAALAGERGRCAKVLEPFDDVLGEDDEGYGDGLTVVMKWGACTDYSVTLADLRDVRKLAAAIRAQGE